MREYETFLETKEFRLKNVIVHEKFEKRADLEKRTFIWHHDIALLELEEEVDLSVYTPVCLPSSVRNRDNTPALAIGKTFIRFSSLFGIVLNSTLRFMEFPLEPSLRNDHNYNPGWGATKGYIHPRNKRIICNRTG